MSFRIMRERASLTQIQASQLLNVPQSTIASWETNRSKPRADKLPAIAKLFGCTIEELLVEEQDDV
ncbi:MAG: helix-turn-helix transcriptional regulator [Phascolarctobacterium sp.]|nr:helix-turn-helix transcriptional regulator [Phascolarctobacterium sp.]